MANVEAIRAAEARRKQESDAKRRELEVRQRAELDLARMQKVKEQVFGTEGWQILREVFLAQHAGELEVLLDTNSELTDAQLRVLQAQLQTSNRIIALDEWVQDRINSLSSKVNAASA
jgi:hypothetical protein